MRNRTSQPGIRTTNAHTNATLEKQNKLPTVQLMLFCRLSDIVAHPVGTGSTSNNSRSWISCLVESLHVQLDTRHQTPYTPDTVYTRRRLHQTKPTKVYTRKSLHHRQFTPDSVYTRHRLHQTWFTPDMVETIAAAIIRRLATKDCKTPRNYALNDDTGTPSSQNYKANSNQSV